MLDVETLRRVKLSTVPYGQLLVKQLLWVDYRLPRRTEIVVEGVERFPDHPVFLAMNHTDRYNYWPLQVALHERGLGFTATWVKGKYYENSWLGRFLGAMNNIPVPSRGYLITTGFRATAGRLPTADEYRLIRDLTDGLVAPGALAADTSPTVLQLVGASESAQQQFVADFVERFAAIAREVVRLNRLALEHHGLHVLIFPEGTRSKRLRAGHVGLAQMTQHLGATIVPIGCSGSDRLYPGNSPFSKGGRVVYRIGEPLAADCPALAPHRVPASVLPFTAEAQRHESSHRAITEVVMSRIGQLVDEPYKRHQRAPHEPTTAASSERCDHPRDCL